MKCLRLSVRCVCDKINSETSEGDFPTGMIPYPDHGRKDNIFQLLFYPQFHKSDYVFHHEGEEMSFLRER